MEQVAEERILTLGKLVEEYSANNHRLQEVAFTRLAESNLDLGGIQTP